MVVIKLWCKYCHETIECFQFDESDDYSFVNPRCNVCEVEECLPFDHVIEVACDSCTRKYLKEKGLEP